MSHLPEPSVEALAVSRTLCRRIAQTIGDAGGWIPFPHYMEMALYSPGCGYYAAGSHKLGSAGDFTTAPEMTPLFGRTLARQVAQLLPETAGTIYEFGAGSGILAADMLEALDAAGSLPERYAIIDLSADLIERQKATLARRVPHLADRIQWLDALPDRLDGIVIGNEVLDAMPCELIRHEGTWRRRGATVKDGALAFEDRPIDDAGLAERAARLVPPLPGYTTEISLANLAFIRTLADRLERGALLFVDYGFPESEYYHPQRHMGTLIGHYRHHTVDDPFFLPGLMDLTCHVDFTAIALAGTEAGLDLIGYTTQAHFLVNAGITEELQALDPNDPARYLPHSVAVQRLVSPAEMGELFKVIGFGRKIGFDWIGFASGDRCHML
ncbi:class I SAM-dependent methyltransferase [Paludibacterium paludis]|uniref:SAM methyltransferase n=1 Tax=Paludibacterium paludis TaxID=1225769 RepID=A0A918UAV3_9NEIS|nr:class I SAM-dependent methyltransferase [Paludibacterium paludis]GGY18521.1 SAM methyltransferase [Paludibacterium paludis]